MPVLCKYVHQLQNLYFALIALYHESLLAAESEIEEKDKQIKDLLQVIYTMTTALNVVESLKAGDMEKTAKAALNGADMITGNKLSQARALIERLSKFMPLHMPVQAHNEHNNLRLEMIRFLEK